METPEQSINVGSIRPVLGVGFKRICQIVLWFTFLTTLLVPSMEQSEEPVFSAAMTFILWVILLYLVARPYPKIQRTGSKFDFRTLSNYALLLPAAGLAWVLPLMWLPFHWVLLALVEYLLFRIRQAEATPQEPQAVELCMKNTILAEDDKALEEEADEEEIDENQLQRWVRFRTDEGKEQMEGVFLLDFLPEQLTGNIHVPFYPPFQQAPRVEVFLLDEAQAKWTLGTVQPYGVRIEVKRADQDEPQRLHLAVMVSD